MCSRVDGKKNASEIVKVVDVSMAIKWGKQAWEEVSSDLIVKCFQKTKLYAKEIDEDDPFEGDEELSSLQELVHEIESTCDALTFISSENQINVCQGYIDDSNPNWREEVRNDLFDDEDEEIGAPQEKRERETAMPQKLTLMNITTKNSRNQLSRQSHRQSGLQSS